MEEYTPYVISGLAIVLTLLFLCRFILFSPRTLKEGELPDTLTVERDAGRIKAQYRWGGVWDYLSFLLFAALAAALVFDARHSAYPTPLGQVFFVLLLGSLLGYAMLVRCLNRTTFTITQEKIAANTGPLPALEKPTNFSVEDLTHVVCRRQAGFGTYALAVRDKTGSLREITDSFSNYQVPDAVARLIAGALPRLQLELDHRTAQERLADRRKARGS